jgi:hypothetical protein
MTQRSMLAGHTPTVVVRAGGSVTVEGWESDRVQVDSDSRWELRIERRRAADLGRERARAVLGDRVLFDVSFDNPFNQSKRLTQHVQGEAIEVQLGDGQVRVPFHSELIVYAGRDAEVRHIQGHVTATAGRDLKLQGVQVLLHAAAGGDLDIDCVTLGGSELKFGAGRDLRFYVRNLTDAQVSIKDLGNYWEALLGEGRTKIKLSAGGDVTLVTDQEVKAQPPYYLLGNIERPAPGADQSTASIETPQQN